MKDNQWKLLIKQLELGRLRIILIKIISNNDWQYNKN